MEARPTAAARLLSVLDCFSPRTPVLSLTEIAQSASLPLSTAHRLVGELADWGALARDEHGGYHLGLKLWELGSLSLARASIREIALPYLGDLFDATGENVHLSVLDGTDVVFLARLAGHRSVGILTTTGSRLPATTTATGRVLLAHAAADTRESALTSPIAAETPHTTTDPETLRAELADIARTGYCVADRQLADDAVAVAAPIRDATARVTAAVAVVGRRETTSVAHLVPAVVTTATGVARSLGYRRPTRRRT
ncbi:IclR family transcriptional regulator [Amycolatopsis sp. Poz14]|uniref:IclR family transcriptional regulator n=1 Tax=Amycolatopsis sp. Poz14 TaxID=1447705 RepID=UPI001EE962F1|nr:IclR family transcriptional regulator [Amycolatopsis sp. Poz14]MCG3756034.1 IclR family transcriptional regulator [Amycolatopsis sp. Poz14]